MKFEWNKALYRILIIATFVALNALLLFGIGAVWTFFNTGADRASMLHLQTNTEEVYAPKLNWIRTKNPGRAMENQTLKEITNDYINAWHVRNIAYEKNDSYGIKDFYTDSARIKLYQNIDLNAKNNTHYKRTTLSHNTALDFYSDDGTLVVFKDYHVEEYQEVYIDNQLFLKEKDTNSYHVMMLLEDGFWRIRHLNTIENQLDTTKFIAPNIAHNNTKIERIKGINYYPKDTPWDTFGAHFNTNIINKDFNTIQSMGLNTIRIFIGYEDFGKNKVDQKKLDALKKLLDAAEHNHLDVMVTLFDFYGAYDVSNWTLTHRHAETIVKAIKNHPALLAWDLKNEPDLDFKTRGRSTVIPWLEQMIEQIKKWDQNHPITIGWSSPEAAVELADKVDFVSYHYYRKASDFKNAHEVLTSKVPNKPKVLQEYGMSSYKGIWNAYTGANKQGQLKYYTEMQKIVSENKIPYMFWTLYDFKKVPRSVAGSLPWKTKKQHYFGCIDTLGNKKPAYKVLVHKNPN